MSSEPLLPYLPLPSCIERIVPAIISARIVSEDSKTLPLLQNKHYAEPSVFQPGNLLREARRQKQLDDKPVPPVCLLDPDGDIVRHLRSTNKARKSSDWPGYHTELYLFEYAEKEFGVIGCAVGSSFAVLVAEQLFAAGCELLISVTSAGQIVPKRDPPYFVLIERALRDEGTSSHYLPPSTYSEMPADLAERLTDRLSDLSEPVYRGASWTTDAPFRETQTAIEAAKTEGILAVEMEAAALYAFAHVTNQMAQTEGDFEKGEAAGTIAALEVVNRIAEHAHESG